MSVLDRLNEDMKAAMKNKEKDKLTVIRSLRSAVQNEAINKQKELTDEDVLTVLTRELKQRKDSLQEFEKADREDLVEKTKREIEIVQHYLPEQLSEEDIRELVSETIQEVGASSKADMGKVMSAIMPKVKGRADGKIVNKIVQETLS